jgi:hypothetical protein
METPALPDSHTDRSAKNYGPLSALLVTLGAFFGSQALAGVAVGLFIKATGKNLEDTVNILSDSTLGQFLFIALVEAFTLGLLYWFIRYRRIKLKEIGLGRRPRRSDLSYGLITFVIYFLLTAFVMAIVKIGSGYRKLI